ncbi:MAG: extracellular solute-binding protein [Chloroflexi bacterium]|nr:extracellular solute-binding protein [Chloroflexota bacterium]
MKRLCWSVMVAILTVLVVGACRLEERPAPAPPPGTPAIAIPAAPWQQEWERILAEARKEETVTWYSFTGAVPRDIIGRILSEKYGIKVDFMAVRSVELFPKVVNERKAGLFIPDVLSGGPGAMVVNFKPSGFLDPIESAVVLPEAKDPAGWLGGQIRFIDKGPSRIISFVASLDNPLAINTEMVQPGELKSYQDLLLPKWKGKIVFNDPSVDGPGLSWYFAVKESLGLDYLRQLAKQELVVIIDQRLQAEWLARGKYAIWLAPSDGPLSQFRQSGAPVQYLMPVEGTALSSGGGSVALMNRAPHPNAARVFINWLLSREGQAIWQKGAGQQSARLDLPDAFAGNARQEGVKYVWISDEESLLKRPAYAKDAAQLFGVVR